MTPTTSMASAAAPTISKTVRLRGLVHKPFKFFLVLLLSFNVCAMGGDS
jgi:hypothetical protein